MCFLVCGDNWRKEHIQLCERDGQVSTYFWPSSVEHTQWAFNKLLDLKAQFKKPLSYRAPYTEHLKEIHANVNRTVMKLRRDESLTAGKKKDHHISAFFSQCYKVNFLPAQLKVNCSGLSRAVQFLLHCSSLTNMTGVYLADQLTHSCTSTVLL